MTVNYTTLLQLPQPVDGTEAGTWGDVLNNAQAAYLDIAIAGGLAVTVTVADVTLAATQGTSSATNIGSTTSQYAILNVSGAMTAARNLIVPSTSKWYIINNTCSGGYTLTVKGAATTGVGIVNGEKALIAWNGSDFVKIATISGAGTFSSITNTGLTTGRVVYTTTGGLETSSANLLYSGTDLTVYGLTVGRGGGAVATNTVVGASALTTNSTGASNTAIGQQALQANTTANNNTAVGYQAAYANTTGAQVTAIGHSAGLANTTASNAVYLGYQAGKSVTTGIQNTILGMNSATALTTGQDNVFVGCGAGESIATSSTNNIGIGRSALQGGGTRNNNTAVGMQSMYGTSTGGDNVAMGINSLYTNSTGGDNIAIGSNALFFSTTASNNTAVGRSAGYANTTGAQLTAIGHSSLTANTTGVNNVGVGYQALQSNTTANNNVAVGTTALQAVTTGSNNTGIGHAAGVSITTGGKNVIIGSYSGSAAPISATGSNYIVLSDGDGNVRQTIDSSGNVGMGTTAPASATNTNSIAIIPGSGQILHQHLNGTASGSVYSYFIYNGSAIASISQNGTTGVLYNLTSDYRLKDNPAPLTGAKDFVMALQPKTWDWWDGSGKGVGFIAHEFMEVAKYSGHGEKDAVDEDNKPIYQSIQPSSSEVMANLVAHIQNLETRLAALETK